MQEPAKRFRHIMYTEAQLVTFGNYLLSRYNVQIHSTDGKNTPIEVRQVHDADLCNWKVDSDIKENLSLPSKFQHGDKVSVKLSDRPFHAFVKGIHFFPGKVKYDLEIPIYDETPTRIYNVDSDFVDDLIAD